MSESVGIQLKVDIGNEVWANTVADAGVIEAMYPAGTTDPAEIYLGEPKVDRHGFEITPVNGVLRFEHQPDGKRAILGNTKHTGEGCPITVKETRCTPEACALLGLKLATAEMARRNCPKANTAETFRLANQEARGRFVLLPVPSTRGAYVLDNEGFTSEYNGDELLQQRLKPAMCVVVTETWLQESGLDEVTFAMNGADGSMGVESDEIEGERVLFFFVSMKNNMGDRSEADQILRQGYNAYFDSKGFDAERRAAALRNALPTITLGASADLPNFAHKILVPSEDSDDPVMRERAARIKVEYADLVAMAGGEITGAITLHDDFKGALLRRHIFPEIEAKNIHLSDKMGIPRQEFAINPGKCPGKGTCHVDYRAETKYSLLRQLREMGVPLPEEDDAVGTDVYDDTQALDPSSPDNKMASNRAEQNQGVDPIGSGVKMPRTNRTLNGVRVRI